MPKVPGFGRLRTQIARMHHRRLGCSAILLYHRVASVPFDPWDLCVSPERLSDQINTARGAGYVTVSLEEAAASRRADAPRIVLTFDDGYADNLYEATPVLKQSKCPATVFVTAGCADYPSGFWWDELQYVVFAPRRLPERLSMQDTPVELEFTLGEAGEYAPDAADHWKAWQPAPSPRHAFYLYLYHRLAALNAVTRVAVLKQIGDWSGADRENRPKLLLNVEEMKMLAESGVELGSHGVTHTPLTLMGTAAQYKELAGSRDQLQAITGASVRAFSYPHGARAENSAELLRSAGYEYACCSEESVVSPGSSAFDLPRISVRNWTGDELLAVLRRFL